eukprot:3342760-Prymnesium_polylepis.1
MHDAPPVLTERPGDTRRLVLKGHRAFLMQFAFFTARNPSTQLELREEAMAMNDVEITDGMRSWSEEDARLFFEFGGQLEMLPDGHPGRLMPMQSTDGGAGDPELNALLGGLSLRALVPTFSAQDLTLELLRFMRSIRVNFVSAISELGISAKDAARLGRALAEEEAEAEVEA